MGIARLLAKGWIVFCIYAGAYALALALRGGGDPATASQSVGLAVVLFIAMGLLFVGGYAASVSHSGMAAIANMRPFHILPGFDEIVFLVFMAAVFAVQIGGGQIPFLQGLTGALQNAIEFAVPGQRVLETVLGTCGLDGGRIFVSAFAWLVALVFLGSALSRLRLAAGLVRLERKGRPEILGAAALVFVLGLCSVVGIQFLYMGSAYTLMPCRQIATLPGAVLIGLGPLTLAYLIKAALTDLLALGPEA